MNDGSYLFSAAQESLKVIYITLNKNLYKNFNIKVWNLEKDA